MTESHDKYSAASRKRAEELADYFWTHQKDASLGLEADDIKLTAWALKAYALSAERDSIIEECAQVVQAKHDELAKRSYPAPAILLTLVKAIRALQGPSAAQGTINQCDGCQRGLPIRDGKYHDLTGQFGAYPGEVMTCTADRYLAPSSARDTKERRQIVGDIVELTAVLQGNASALDLLNRVAGAAFAGLDAPASAIRAPTERELLKLLVDYHDNQASGAEAMGVDGSVKYHDRQSAKFKAMLEKLPATEGRSA
jgi:hypothetical protein